MGRSAESELNFSRVAPGSLPSPPGMSRIDRDAIPGVPSLPPARGKKLADKVLGWLKVLFRRPAAKQPASFLTCARNPFPALRLIFRTISDFWKTPNQNMRVDPRAPSARVPGGKSPGAYN